MSPSVAHYIKRRTGDPAIRPAVLLRDLAVELGESFYLVKGFALGRGMAVSRIGQAEVISHEDAATIRKELPRHMKRLRAKLAHAS